MDLKEFQIIKQPKGKFPDKFNLIEKIYSPLQVLHYNLTFAFSDDYPAKMPEDFARDMILLYSKKGDIVWDGCCGSGTVPIVASRLGRFGIGTDVNPNAIELCKNKIYETDCNLTKIKLEVQDCRAVNLERKADLILSSLPFGLNIIGDKNNYSSEKGDLSNSHDYDSFFAGSRQIIQSYYDNLKPGGVCVLDARDRLHKGKTIPLILEFLSQARQVGFELVTRFYYDLIPYRQMTYKHKPSGHVKAMPSTMDAIVLTKLENETLG